MNVSNSGFCTPADAPTFEGEFYTSSLGWTLLAGAVTGVLGALSLKNIAKKAVATHDTGQRNIDWILKKTQVMLKSSYQSMRHKLNAQFNPAKRSEHFVESIKHFGFAQNAYYELRGLPKRVYVVHNEKGLVRTYNRPKRNFMKSKGQAKLEKQLENVVLDLQKKGFSQFTAQKHRFDQLEEGVCSGMCQQFIDEYYKNRAKGYELEKAAKGAASLFSKGATRKACLYHQFQFIGLDGENVSDQGITRSEYCKAIFQRQVPYLLKSGYTIDGYEFVHHRFDEHASLLQDGVYLTITNICKSVWDSPYTFEISELEGTTGHATVLIVEDEKFLIFDPNEGLMRSKNPDHYYNSYTTTPSAVTLCASIDREEDE